MLVEPPIELLVHWITKLKPTGDGSHYSDVIAFQLPHLCYAHVGDALIRFLSSDKRRRATLNARHFEALGFSAIAPADLLLSPQVEVEQLQTFRQALDAGIPRKSCCPTDFGIPDGQEYRYLDRAGSSAIAAITALRRLGHCVDADRVKDWLRQLDRVFGADSTEHAYRDGTQALRWILFDQGDDQQFDWFVQRHVGVYRHDIAMSLLRRGDHARFDQWMHQVPEKHPNLVHPPRSVRFWPLIDHLQSRGISVFPSNGDGYLLARAAGVSAPDGWTWQTQPVDDAKLS
jgi:hypothetical protein